MVDKKWTIDQIAHPFYLSSLEDWIKWRVTYEGGRLFICNYLKTFSTREDAEDFKIRKCTTYCPAFAKEAVNDVKNAIFQRMADVNRTGGSDNYQTSCAGLEGGVDRKSSTMTTFMGTKVLPELLTMKRVGVFIDMPPLDGPTMLDEQGKKPWLYVYYAEDIRNWIGDFNVLDGELNSVLLRDTVLVSDPDTGYPVGERTRYRSLQRIVNPETGKFQVRVKIYQEGGDPDLESEIHILDIPRIPFVVFEIAHSLLQDTADYQIALLNLESSDISYTLKSNFPIWIEQYDPRAENPYIRDGNDADGTTEGQAATSATASTKNIKVGVSHGRRYPLLANPPAFINPSPEPLQASMAKEKQLKEDIRLLTHLAISNLSTAGRASAESKQTDERSLENGLASIGLILQRGEQQIAEIWANYEGKESATVKYPEEYSLKSDQERRAEAKDLADLMVTLPSRTYQREIGKRIAKIMLGLSSSKETLNIIDGELDDSINMVCDPTIITQDVEYGLVDHETASKLRGYPAGVVEKAKQEQTERAAEIAAAQASASALKDPAARGVPQLDPNPHQSASQEKTQSRSTTLDLTVKKKTRGQGKGD